MSDPRQERPDWLPDFFTEEWLHANLLFTQKDRREISELLAQSIKDWPIGRVGSEEFIRAYYENSIEDPLFPHRVENITKDKYSRKADKKGLRGSIYPQTVKAIKDANGTSEMSWTSIELRSAMAKVGKLNLYAQLLWLELIMGIEVSDIGERIEADKELEEKIGGVWEYIRDVKKASSDENENTELVSDDSQLGDLQLQWEKRIDHLKTLLDQNRLKIPELKFAEKIANEANQLPKLVSAAEALLARIAEVRDADNLPNLRERILKIEIKISDQTKYISVAEAVALVKKITKKISTIGASDFEVLTNQLDLTDLALINFDRTDKKYLSAIDACSNDPNDDKNREKLTASLKARDEEITNLKLVANELVHKTNIIDLNLRSEKLQATDEPTEADNTSVEEVTNAPGNSEKGAASPLLTTSVESASEKTKFTGSSRPDRVLLVNIDTVDHIPEPDLNGEEIIKSKAAKENEEDLGDTAASLNEDVVTAFGRVCVRGEYSLAHHLALATEQLGIAQGCLPRSQSMALYNTGRAIRSAGGRAALEFWRLLQTFTKVENNVNLNNAEIICTDTAFIFGGALRPALFAPESGARQLLHNLPLGVELNFLHELRQSITELDAKGYYTSPGQLRGLGDIELPRRALENMRNKLFDWVAQSRNTKIAYESATNVWRKLLDREGKLGGIVELIRNDGKDAKLKAIELIGELSTSADIDRIIHATDQSLRDVQNRRIEARALIKLRNNVETAVEHISNWLEAVASTPNNAKDEASDNLQRRLTNCLADARRAAAELSRQEDLQVVSAAGHGLLTAFDELEALLNGLDDPSPITHQFAVNGDLLKLSGLFYDGGWIPTPYRPEQVLEEILDYAASEPNNWERALQDRSDEANHLATKRIIEIMDRLSVAPSELDALKIQRDNDVEHARTEISKRRDSVRRDLDRAMQLDRSGDLALSNHLDRLEAFDPQELPQEERSRDLSAQSTDAISDFPAALSILKSAEVAISRVNEKARQHYLQRIELLQANGGAMAQQAQRLRALLDEGDLLSLSEYVDTVEHGGELPNSDYNRDAFDDFFPDFVATLDEEQTPFRHVLKAARDNRSEGTFDFSSFSPDRLDDVQQILINWSTLKKRGLSGNPREAISQLFEAIGFREVKIEEDKRSGASERTRRYKLRVQAIADKGICPVSKFGSKANGHYEIIVYSPQASEEEILSESDSHASGTPRIALSLGRLSVKQRRTFSRLSRKKRTSVLLIDEALLLFLVCYEGYRLPALFATALPFTWLDPYSTTPSNTPIEAFYGRKAEIAKIIDPEGPSLVYGGRQLGKSALLAHVAKLFDNPEQGYIVRVLDCRQVGRTEPTEQIWARISDDLLGVGVVTASTKDGAKVAQDILAWLSKNQNHRLLIQLDEMDRFMTEEVSSDYEHLVLMKDLMLRSDRRCKFVFAGLHDVQRFAKTINTPLAHFGEPICVGPLYGDDLAAAHRLVTQPLASAGYRFESDGLALRILTDVLYYPSLVQIYCKQLLDNLRQENFGENDGPRYTITPEMVERSLAGSQLRDSLIQRFELTLSLDQRYRLIALILTLHTIEDRNRYVDGYSLKRIRADALNWWPQGFSDVSIDSFRALLDEMCGLGVLHERPDGWRLRSTKIASMMGPPDQLEQDLLEFESRDVELLYEPSTYHRVIQVDGLGPAPLTQRQEYDLFQNRARVTIIVGSEIQGIDEVAGSIKSIGQSVQISLLSGLTDERSFGNALSKLAGRKSPSMLVIDRNQPWTMSWVRGAIKHKVVKRGNVRVLFIGGSEWALDLAENRDEANYGHSVQIFSLRPWNDHALKLWLNDVTLDFLNSPEERAKLLGETGGYQQLIRSLGDTLHGLPRDWRQRRKHWTTKDRWRIANFGSFGILPQMEKFVIALAEVGQVNITTEDVAELPQIFEFELPVPQDVAFVWAETLGYIRPVGSDKWQVSSFLLEMMTQNLAKIK